MKKSLEEQLKNVRAISASRFQRLKAMEAQWHQMDYKFRKIVDMQKLVDQAAANAKANRATIERQAGQIKQQAAEIIDLKTRLRP